MTEFLSTALSLVLLMMTTTSPANAGPAALVLFGAFLVWAIVDYLSLRSRSVDAEAAPARAANTVGVLVLGTVLAGVFAMWLHLWLIGVAPLG